jgi:hypothetical protein
VLQKDGSGDLAKGGEAMKEINNINDILDDIARMWRGLFLLLAALVTIFLVAITSPLWVVPYLLIKRKRGDDK